MPVAAFVGLWRRAQWTQVVLWMATGIVLYALVEMIGGVVFAGSPPMAPVTALPPLGIYFAAAMRSRRGWTAEATA